MMEMLHRTAMVLDGQVQLRHIQQQGPLDHSCVSKFTNWPKAPADRAPGLEAGKTWLFFIKLL
jgi:hypothetical protein